MASLAFASPWRARPLAAAPTALVLLAAPGGCARLDSAPAPTLAATRPAAVRRYELRFEGELIGVAEERDMHEDRDVREDQAPSRWPAEAARQRGLPRFDDDDEVGAAASAALTDRDRERVARGGPQTLLRRRERVRFRRGAEVVRIDTDLAIWARAGRAVEISVELRDCSTPPAELDGPSWDQPCPRADGPRSYRAHARRTARGWQVEQAAGPARRLPAEAEPAEWLELAPRAEPEQARPVFFAARRFALGRARRAFLGPSAWLGTVELADGRLDSTTELGADGRPRLTIDASGLVARRVDELPGPAPLADLVALTTLPIAGAQAPAPPREASPGPVHLVLSLRAPAAPPTAAQSQRVEARGARWRVELVRQPDGPDVAPLAALARAIAETPPGPGEPPGADCTALALRYARAARRRGIPTRLVTGLVLDGAALVRHRWAQSYSGERWIVVDPASGSAPAPARLLALAVHGDSVEALAAAEAAYAPVRGAQVEWAP